MTDDIFEQISQGGGAEETAENRRIHEIADELRRRCQLYEKQSRGCKENVIALETEQRITEQYAKEKGLWLSFADISNLGVPGPSGNENDLYVSNDIVFKVNNLLNCGSVLHFLDRLMWHNDLFYDTAYTLFGFTGFESRTVMPYTHFNKVDFHHAFEMRFPEMADGVGLSRLSGSRNQKSLLC